MISQVYIGTQKAKIVMMLLKGRLSELITMVESRLGQESVTTIESDQVTQYEDAQSTLWRSQNFLESNQCK